MKTALAKAEPPCLVCDCDAGVPWAGRAGTWTVGSVSSLPEHLGDFPRRLLSWSQPFASRHPLPGVWCLHDMVLATLSVSEMFAWLLLHGLVVVGPSS